MVATAPPAWGAAAPGILGEGVPLTRLQRPRASRMLAGVCAGLAQHYRWELTWTRVLAVLIAVFSSGAGVVAYIVFWIVMPEEPWRLSSGGVAGPDGYHSAQDAAGSAVTASTTREV